MRVKTKPYMLSFLGAVLFLAQSAVAQTSGSVAANPDDEIKQALAIFSDGSPQAMLDRLRPRQAAPFTQAEQKSVRESLPQHIIPLVVAEGPLVERARSAASEVFKLHRLAGAWNVVVFKCEKPLIATWYLQEILISTALVEMLSDAELRGVLAHEAAHSYFVNELVLARKANDAALVRVVELQCDAVSALSLILLDVDPLNLHSGLAKFLARARDFGLEGNEYAPDLETRRKLILKVSALVKTHTPRLEV